MEEQTTYNSDTANEFSGCRNCGSQYVEQGYQLNLCENCRDTFINRPIPAWVKVFFAIIVLILGYAFSQFPHNIQPAVALERGIRAEKAKKYLTAVNEYKKVLEKYPNSELAIGRLFIAYYKSDKIYEAAEAISKIAGRESKKEDLVNEINQVADRMASLYYPSEELSQILSKHQNAQPEEIISVLKPYVNKNPNDLMGAYYLADKLFDVKKFDESEQLVMGILKSYPDFNAGYLFLAAVCREKGQYERGLDYCQKVLEQNIESAQAYVSMSRIELKRHQDEQGLQLAEKAYSLDSDNAHVIANLALAYHYNGMLEERDRIFDLFKKHKGFNEYDLNFLTSIFSGEVKWRE